MDPDMRAIMAHRADHKCEYCRLAEAYVPAGFHVEHIIPKKHLGTNDIANLCYSCSRCNLHKGSNLSGIDQDTGQVVRLFDPRRQIWDEHFAWNGAIVMGLTSVGRATVHVLQMNIPRRIQLRARLLARGLMP